MAGHIPHQASEHCKLYCLIDCVRDINDLCVIYRMQEESLKVKVTGPLVCQQSQSKKALDATNRLSNIQSTWSKISEHFSFLVMVICMETRKMAIKIDMCPEPAFPKTERPSSVMEPYRKGLRLVKFLGLPMKIKLSADGNITFEDHLRLVKCSCASGNTNYLVLAIDCKPSPPPLGKTLYWTTKDHTISSV